MYDEDFNNILYLHFRTHLATYKKVFGQRSIYFFSLDILTISRKIIIFLQDHYPRLYTSKEWINIALRPYLTFPHFNHQGEVSLVVFLSFKGSLTRDFRLQVFFMNQCPPGPQVFHWCHFDFFRKIGGDIHEWIFNDTGDKLFSGVNDTGEKFILVKGKYPKSLKFFAGVNDTAEKLFTGVNDTTDKLFRSVNYTGD
jgi:hypothetical protein